MEIRIALHSMTLVKKNNRAGFDFSADAGLHLFRVSTDGVEPAS